jgi:tetratricopeptide (TPR) repeat protein
VSLEKTAMDEPGDPESFLILADQAFQQGRMIEAEALYDKVMQLNEKFQGNAKRKRNFEVRARAGRASVAQRRKKWDAAVADLQALVKADPENARAHYLLGQTLFMLKKTKEGKAEFDAAKKLDKDKVIPDPWVAVALMCDQLDMAAETQTAFDNALKSSKTDPTTITAYTQWRRGLLCRSFGHRTGQWRRHESACSAAYRTARAGQARPSIAVRAY